MKTIKLLQAWIEIWRADSTFIHVPIRSTRIPATSITNTPMPDISTVFPYAYIEANLVYHQFDSGNKISDYIVSITYYGGNTKQIVNDAVDHMAEMYNFHLLKSAFSDSAYVLSVMPLTDNNEVDEDNFYGADINEATISWKVKLNEIRETIKLN